MVSMRKFWLGLLIWCGAMWGQQTNTVYSTLFTNTAAPVIVPVSGTLTNIGQSNHQVVLVFSNAPSHTCSNKTATGQLEFSYDNTNWLVFGSPTAAITSANTAIWFGSGAFPFVRFNLTSFDTTNCRVSGYYSGILGGALSTQVTGQQPVGQQVLGSLRPIVIGGLSGVDNTNRSIVAAVPICNKSFSFKFSTDNTTHLVSGITSAGVSIKVCSVVINSNPITTPADDTNIRIFQGTDNTCSVLSATFIDVTVARYSVASMNGGISPLFTTASGTSLCVQGASGTSATNQYDGIITYAVIDDSQ